jgi:hypothetical protein
MKTNERIAVRAKNTRINKGLVRAYDAHPARGPEPREYPETIDFDLSMADDEAGFDGGSVEAWYAAARGANWERFTQTFAKIRQFCRNTPREARRIRIKARSVFTGITLE